MNRWKVEVNGKDLRDMIANFDGEPEQGAEIIQEMRNILEEHREDFDEVNDFLFLLDGEDEAFFKELEDENSYQEYNFNDLNEWMEDRVFQFWDVCDAERIVVSF